MALFLYAPNVHAGGGATLLMELLETCGGSVDHCILDTRIESRVPDDFPVVRYVKNTILSRISAELWLSQNVGNDDKVLFFHSLPPLFPVRGRVIVFVQNRLILEKVSHTQFPFRVALRHWVERLWCRVFRGRVFRYVVQTPSMSVSLRHFLRPRAEVSVVAFQAENLQSENRQIESPLYDFVYVASGDAHKNHRTLIDAWILLAQSGLRPSLALTVSSEQFAELTKEISVLSAIHALNISNLGHISSESVENLYRSSRALIFPSKLESLGLPLVEAHRIGLPILAAELDYVRDVVCPIETFDPNSHVSIARSVMRFLGKPEPIVQMQTAAEFMTAVLR